MALQPFSIGMATTAIQIGGVLAPFAVYGIVRRSREICLVTALTLALGLGQTAILFIPSIGWLSTLHFNWLQKLTVFFCTLGMVKVCRFSKTECGLNLPEKKSAWAIALLIGLLLGAIDCLAATEHLKTSAETILFESSMPGLQEEPFYRGLLLCIWDKCFGRPWKAFGVQFGMGCVVTSVLFAVGHLVGLDSQWHLEITLEPLAWLDFMAFALSMCWLRYKFESVWPAVLAHNVSNALCPVYSEAVMLFR